MENNNPLFCTTQDRLRLRELAKKHVEIAGSPKNLERVALWKRHNAFKGERPVIHIEAGTFQHQVLAPLLRCESPLARSVEYNLLQDFINLEQFDDDKVVPPYYMLGINTGFCLFDIRVKESIITNSAGTAQGHKFEHPVKNLHKACAKQKCPHRKRRHHVAFQFGVLSLPHRDLRNKGGSRNLRIRKADVGQRLSADNDCDNL